MCPKDNEFFEDAVLEFAQGRLGKKNIKVWKACGEWFAEDIERKREYLVCLNANDELDDLWLI